MLTEKYSSQVFLAEMIIIRCFFFFFTFVMFKALLFYYYERLRCTASFDICIHCRVVTAISLVTNPSLYSWPLSLTPLVTTNLFYLWVFFCFILFVPILLVLDSTYDWNCVVFVLLPCTYFSLCNTFRSIQVVADGNVSFFFMAE